jgi:hypothetical protein
MLLNFAAQFLLSGFIVQKKTARPIFMQLAVV